MESVFKEPEAYSVFNGRNLPSFVKDWLIKCFSEYGSFNKSACLEFLDEKLPRKGISLRKRLLSSVEPIQIFSRLIVSIDLANGKWDFAIPDLGIGKKDGKIASALTHNKSIKLHEGEMWGILLLSYIAPDESSKGYVELTDFRPFEPYKVDLEYYRQARKNFNTLEWIDLLIRSMETNPDYQCGQQRFELDKKITYLSRLLVFLEPNLNMIELAPKGTGKSYVYNNLSKYGWTVSGGIVTRAGIFYNIASRTPGIIHHYDFLALDEVETLQFAKEEDILGAFKNYLENGKIVVGNYQNISDCGLMLLGNIPLNSRFQPKDRLFFAHLPAFLRSSALIDRIHGFIPGWNLFRFTEDLKLRGLALNSEYFSEIMHLLRFETSFYDIVKEALVIPPNADTRDTKAVQKLCSAYLKLLYPHVIDITEIPREEFSELVLKPALRSRGIIRRQLAEMDSEFNPQMPEITLRKY